MSDLILRSRSAALGAGLLTSPDQPTVGLPPLLVCCGVRLRFVGPVWSGRSGGDLRSKWCGVRRPAHSAEVVRGRETRAQRGLTRSGSFWDRRSQTGVWEREQNRPQPKSLVFCGVSDRYGVRNHAFRRRFNLTPTGYPTDTPQTWAIQISGKLRLPPSRTENSQCRATESDTFETPFSRPLHPAADARPCAVPRWSTHANRWKTGPCWRLLFRNLSIRIRVSTMGSVLKLCR